MVEFEELDDVEIPEPPTKDPDACIFRHCANKSAGAIKYTDGKSEGEARVCEPCFERHKSERPYSATYSCGGRLFIQELWW